MKTEINLIPDCPQCGIRNMRNAHSQALDLKRMTGASGGQVARYPGLLHLALFLISNHNSLKLSSLSKGSPNMSDEYYLVFLVILITTSDCHPNTIILVTFNYNLNCCLP